jgi:hypothetical protein
LPYRVHLPREFIEINDIDFALMGKDFQLVDTAADFGKLIGYIPAAVKDGDLFAEGSRDKIPAAAHFRFCRQSVYPQKLFFGYPYINAFGFIRHALTLLRKKVTAAIRRPKEGPGFIPARSFVWERQRRVHTKGNLDVSSANEKRAPYPTASRGA